MFCCMQGLFAQRQTTSPFTRYGYGDLFSNSTAYNQAMGGIGVGQQTKTQINFLNPAHQSSVQKETFLFNVALGANIRHAKEDDVSATFSSVGLESFSMAFPIIPDRWGCAVGLLPFNSVGYSMNYKDSLAEYTYTGDGGINQVALSTGLRIFKGLSLGVHTAFVFGTTDYTGENSFTDNSSFHARKRLEYKTKGFLWNVGLQYNWEIAEGKTITAGTTFRSEQSFSYKQTEYFGSFFTNGVLEYQKDTATLTDSESDTGIPLEIAFGLGYKFDNHYSFGIDAGVQKWEGISCYGVTDSNLKQTKYIKLGGEWIPDYRSSRFYKKMPIRMGFHYSDLPIIFTYNNEYAQAKEFGFTLGSRIQSKQTRNNLSFAADFGVRGNSSLAKSLQETYLQIKLNITLQEVWFTKRKIN